VYGKIDILENEKIKIKIKKIYIRGSKDRLHHFMIHSTKWKAKWKARADRGGGLITKYLIR
jgi:hypothetical protein